MLRITTRLAHSRAGVTINQNKRAQNSINIPENPVSHFMWFDYTFHYSINSRKNILT